MANINKFIGIGNTTRDPELRRTQSGQSVCNFTVAINDSFTGSDGKKIEKVEFVPIVCWGYLADLCTTYIKKGKQVYVEGRLQSRSYEDKAGVTKYITEVIAETVQFLDSHQKNDVY